MKINSAANVAIFYSLILDVSNFNLIDVWKLNQILFNIQDEDQINDSVFNKQFESMGYTSRNMIQNIGIIFYIQMLLVIVALVNNLAYIQISLISIK